MLTASEFLPVAASRLASPKQSGGLPEAGTFFFGQCDELNGERLRRCIVAAHQMRNACDRQHVHQCTGVARPARLTDRLFCACQRSFRIAKRPQCQRPPDQNDWYWPPQAATARCRHRLSFDRTGKRMIQIDSALRHVSREKQDKTQELLGEPQRLRTSHFLGKCHDVRGTLAGQVAVEVHNM